MIKISVFLLAVMEVALAGSRSLQCSCMWSYKLIAQLHAHAYEPSPHCYSKLSLTLAYTSVVYVHVCTHTQCSGKIARQWCRKAFLKNDLQPLYTRTSAADVADSGIYTESADAATANNASTAADSSGTKHSTASVQQQPPLQVNAKLPWCCNSDCYLWLLVRHLSLVTALQDGLSCVHMIGAQCSCTHALLLECIYNGVRTNRK
jgi:hypothetical protein